MTADSVGQLLISAGRRPARPLTELVTRLTAAGLLVGPAPTVGAAPTSATTVSGGIAYDSRRTRPGSVFVAVAGEHVDGHDFAAAAADNGAVAAIVERPLANLRIPQLVVLTSRPALAQAACWWYGDPSRELAVVGITGTDGKTTTSYLATAALEGAGLRPGMVGTIATRIGGLSEPDVEHQTTPEAPELQAALRAMVEAGDQVAVIETTSHGLALGRVAGIAYRAAILTNLSHEHLELHGTFEAYRAAKLRLFELLATGAAERFASVGIVNADDRSADRFAETTRAAGAELVTYGVGAAADVRGIDITDTSEGVRFTATTEGWRDSIALRLRGRFNVHNALAVVALGHAWGLDPDAVGAGLSSITGVPGRMERIDAGQPFEVVVDFAHSPASLAAVLDELGPLAASRGGGVIAVFGSAGERDTAKRPLMGRIAGERCRLIVATDEDPRGEDGDAILDEIAAGAEAAGCRRGEDVLLIRDRRTAIGEAFGRARPSDVVLLAGKGHERSIIGPTGPIPWDEAAVARGTLASMGWAHEDVIA
jgi:UDP-N-acetylmuramoyl-L-alanyl-D-glutamate--2,6-diaminopimelate ligase